MSNHLFFLSLADIFSVYPKIFRELIANENRNPKSDDLIYLPSDEEWQERVYYRLLDVQRKINESLESGMMPEEITRKKDRPVFDPTFVIEKFSPATTPDGGRYDPRRRCAPDHPIEFIDADQLGCWSLEIIAKAAKLLRKPPMPVEFGNEHEMRRVYSLIYDVFRYKVVLSSALTDITFFAHYPSLFKHQNLVWLMLFELFTRHFLKRKSGEIGLQNQLYKEAEVDEIAQCLWKHRVRLAASISRMRIKNGALELSRLLPTHLQNEKVAIAAANPIVSGWINPFQLANKVAAEAYLNKLGLKEVEQGDKQIEQPLQENQFKWDRICPLFLSLLPRDRSQFSQTDVVRNHCLIMQDRTFALAPAIMARLLDHYELEGDIVQTHIASPRSTAYLASLFRATSRVNHFLVFGCGSMVGEYTNYMKTLGIKSVRLYAEPFKNVPLESTRFDRVVGVLATPPNSFSAVSDPIDLICSRGGDLNMLQIMTESEISDAGKKRVEEILEEQKETLRLCMSRPQIQFVLYQTHSVVECENREMVDDAVASINQKAFEKHLHYYQEKLAKEAQAEAEAAAIPSAAMGSTPRKRAVGTKTDESPQNKLPTENRESLSQSERTGTVGESMGISHIIRVPKTDQFEVAKIPDVCINQDSCLDLASMGCYVALIKRRKITRLDEKYLIKMAEKRGLFGKSRDKSAKSRSAKKQEKIEMKKPVETQTSKIRKLNQDGLIERLNHPTHASYVRSNLRKMSSVESKYMSFNGTKRLCSRYSKMHRDASMDSSLSVYPRARRWWETSVKYIQLLQKRSRKRKLSFEDRIDIGKLMKYAKYPFFLPYRQRRNTDKEPYPVSVSFIDFKQNDDDFSSCYSSECSFRRFRESTGYNTLPLIKSRYGPRPLGFFTYDH